MFIKMKSLHSFVTKNVFSTVKYLSLFFYWTQGFNITKLASTSRCWQVWHLVIFRLVLTFPKWSPKYESGDLHVNDLFLSQVLNKEILEKPKDKDNAFSMLKRWLFDHWFHIIEHLMFECLFTVYIQCMVQE